MHCINKEKFDEWIFDKTSINKDYVIVLPDNRACIQTHALSVWMLDASN